MSFYFVPQTSPDDVTNQIEGLTVTSKYKRTWVALRQVEVQVYCPMKPLDIWNFSCLLIRKQNIHFSHRHFQRSFDKKAPPVSMSKLLSHGYVEDKKKSPNDDDCSSTILVSLTEGSCVICSKATAVSVSLCVTWHSRCFPRCDLGTDEHHRHWGRGRPGVVAGALPPPLATVRGLTNPQNTPRCHRCPSPVHLHLLYIHWLFCTHVYAKGAVLLFICFNLWQRTDLSRMCRCSLCSWFSVFCSIWKTSRWQVGRLTRRRFGSRHCWLGVRFLPWLYEDRVSEFLTCLCSRRVVPVMWNVLLSDGMFAAAGVSTIVPAAVQQAEVYTEC